MTAQIIPSTSGKFQKVYATLINNNDELSGHNSLEIYAPSDNDNGADTGYFGFIDSSGNWYIMKEVRTTGATTTSTIRYIKGTTDYATNWTNRASLSYDYFNTIFGA